MEPGVLAARRTQCAVGRACFDRTHANGTDGVGRAVERQAVSHRHHLLRTVVLAVGAGTRSGQRSLLSQEEVASEIMLVAWFFQ